MAQNLDFLELRKREEKLVEDVIEVLKAQFMWPQYEVDTVITLMVKLKLVNSGLEKLNTVNDKYIQKLPAETLEKYTEIAQSIGVRLDIAMTKCRLILKKYTTLLKSLEPLSERSRMKVISSINWMRVLHAEKVENQTTKNQVSLCPSWIMRVIGEGNNKCLIDMLHVTKSVAAQLRGHCCRLVRVLSRTWCEDGDLSGTLCTAHWVLLDRMALNGELCLVPENSLVDQNRQLWSLYHLVQLYGAHHYHLPRTELPKALAAFIHIHDLYNTKGRVLSLICLQRRWYELVRLSRNATMKRYKCMLTCRSANWDCFMQINRLYWAVVTSFPSILMTPLPKWEWLVSNQYVIHSKEQYKMLYGDIPPATTWDINTVEDDNAAPSDGDVEIVETAQPALDRDISTKSDSTAVIDISDDEDIRLEIDLDDASQRPSTSPKKSETEDARPKESSIDIKLLSSPVVKLTRVQIPNEQPTVNLCQNETEQEMEQQVYINRESNPSQIDEKVGDEMALTEEQMQFVKDSYRPLIESGSCCRVRRSRNKSKLQRRLAANKGTALPSHTLNHTHRSGDKCKCCCLHLLERDATNMKHVKQARHKILTLLKDVHPDVVAKAVQDPFYIEDELAEFMLLIKEKAKPPLLKIQRKKTQQDLSNVSTQTNIMTSTVQLSDYNTSPLLKIRRKKSKHKNVSSISTQTNMSPPVPLSDYDIWQIEKHRTKQLIAWKKTEYPLKTYKTKNKKSPTSSLKKKSPKTVAEKNDLNKMCVTECHFDNSANETLSLETKIEDGIKESVLRRDIQDNIKDAKTPQSNDDEPQSNNDKPQSINDEPQSNNDKPQSKNDEPQSNNDKQAEIEPQLIQIKNEIIDKIETENAELESSLNVLMKWKETIALKLLLKSNLTNISTSENISTDITIIDDDINVGTDTLNQLKKTFEKCEQKSSNYIAFSKDEIQTNEVTQTNVSKKRKIDNLKTETQNKRVKNIDGPSNQIQQNIYDDIRRMKGRIEFGLKPPKEFNITKIANTIATERRNKYKNGKNKVKITEGNINDRRKKSTPKDDTKKQNEKKRQENIDAYESQDTYGNKDENDITDNVADPMMKLYLKERTRGRVEFGMKPLKWIDLTKKSDISPISTTIKIEDDINSKSTDINSLISIAIKTDDGEKSTFTVNIPEKTQDPKSNLLLSNLLTNSPKEFTHSPLSAKKTDKPIPNLLPKPVGNVKKPLPDLLPRSLNNKITLTSDNINDQKVVNVKNSLNVVPKNLQDNSLSTLQVNKHTPIPIRAFNFETSKPILIKALNIEKCSPKVNTSRATTSQCTEPESFATKGLKQNICLVKNAPKNTTKSINILNLDDDSELIDEQTEKKEITQKKNNKSMEKIKKKEQEESKLSRLARKITFLESSDDELHDDDGIMDFNYDESIKAENEVEEENRNIHASKDLDISETKTKIKDEVISLTDSDNDSSNLVIDINPTNQIYQSASLINAIENPSEQTVSETDRNTTSSEKARWNTSPGALNKTLENLFQATPKRSHSNFGSSKVYASKVYLSKSQARHTKQTKPKVLKVYSEDKNNRRVIYPGPNQQQNVNVINQNIVQNINIGQANVGQSKSTPLIHLSEESNLPIFNVDGEACIVINPKLLKQMYDTNKMNPSCKPRNQYTDPSSANDQSVNQSSSANNQSVYQLSSANNQSVNQSSSANNQSVNQSSSANNQSFNQSTNPNILNYNQSNTASGLLHPSMIYLQSQQQITSTDNLNFNQSGSSNNFNLYQSASRNNQPMRADNLYPIRVFGSAPTDIEQPYNSTNVPEQNLLNILLHNNVTINQSTSVNQTNQSGSANSQPMRYPVRVLRSTPPASSPITVQQGSNINSFQLNNININQSTSMSNQTLSDPSINRLMDSSRTSNVYPVRVIARSDQPPNYVNVLPQNNINMDRQNSVSINSPVPPFNSLKGVIDDEGNTILFE